ncbi:MAG: ribosomal protection-like ABC-F family protein [Bacilli bacterium]
MQVSNLKAGFKNNEILKDISFHLAQGEKVGLVGPNGSGKSTLLKVLSNELPLDSGKIKLENETITYLKQEISHEFDDYSIIDYIKKQTGIGKLEIRLSELENNLTDDNMDEYGDILDNFLSLDGYSFESNLQNLIDGLNLDKSLDSKISTLSGGEKIKVLLCAMLLSNGDILLLDEPTNNLDIEAIDWLENYLHNLKKSIIMVSHDEVFLNNIVSKIFEMSDGKLNEYNLSYDDYLKQKDLEYEKDKLKYLNAIEERKKIKVRLQKAKDWSNKGTSSKAHNDNDKIANNFAKERTRSSEVSKLSKALDEIDIPTFQERKKINFFLDLDNEKGNKNIYVDDLVCGYENFQTVPLKLNIDFGSKISIKGNNGSGKTTFIKTILGLIKPIDGNIIIGNDVKIGYISQDTIINDKNISVYKFITSGLDDIDCSLVFTLLNNFGFNYDDRDKKYSELSPGQRTRVNLAKIALHKINVLILDEITNHLDKEALELIYELVESYPGTIISISHNRKYNEILNADYSLDISTGNIEYLQNNTHKKR